MAEKCFYRVENNGCELFEKACKFLALEEEMCQTQEKAVTERLPKFTICKQERGFNRIARFTGFVFDDQDSIDLKVWRTKNVDGYMLSVPNLRTKAGKEMDRFLNSFKSTTCWDVDRLLGIDKEVVQGNFVIANLFKYDGCIYIIIDEKFRKAFEAANPYVIEITYGAMEKAIEGYKSE